MKKLFAILSAISLMLYALVDFGKNVLETYFHIQLMNGVGNFASSDYSIDVHTCQTVLLAVGLICLVVFIVSLFMKDKK